MCFKTITIDIYPINRINLTMNILTDTTSILKIFKKIRHYCILAHIYLIQSHKVDFFLDTFPNLNMIKINQ